MALINAGVVGSPKGEARFRVDEDCDMDFRVEIEDVPLGDYELRVDGVDRGTITVVLVVDTNEGQIEFDTEPNDPDELPWSFDPRGTQIEIVDGADQVLLNRAFPAS